MKEQKIHYAGRLAWRDKRGARTDIFAGFAACCSGDQAQTIRRQGNHTYEPAEVTCKPCLQRLEWARVYAESGTAAKTPLERAEAYIADLEAHITAQHTCIVCSATLIPANTPPHCEDTCHPEDDQVGDWEHHYLDDPVKQLRARHGR